MINQDDKLKILSETIKKISTSMEEEKRVEIVFDAFQKLGYTDAFRCRVGVISEDGNYLSMRYGRGNYGKLDIGTVSYNISNSLTGNIITGGGTLSYEADQGHLPTEERKEVIQSMLVMPLNKNGVIVGIFSLDSQKSHSFSEEDVQTLEPYSYVLANTMAAPVPSHRMDVIDFISKSKKKQLLILGKDSGDEVKLLHQLSNILKEMGYEPLLVKDYPDIPEMSNEEKVRVFADAAKFVILENSYPAGQIAELKMCSSNRIITACLREEGKGSSYMVTDYSKDYDFIKEFEYKQDDTLLRQAISNAINWAEDKIQERIAYYDSKYPWRSNKAKDKLIDTGGGT
ncbi:MAG: GAF domain-containing protein [Bacteroidota bacterium]|jgi:hypothetical protein